MPELKATPQSSILGAIADALTSVRDTGDKVRIPLIDMGLGELLLGKTPEEINEWSYGNAPLRVVGGGTGSRVPQLKQGRAQQVLDTLFTAPSAGPLARASGRMIVNLPRAVEHGAQEFARASAAANPRVIKQKGGNWLTGSVEKALEGLKRGIPHDFDVPLDVIADRLQVPISKVQDVMRKDRPRYDSIWEELWKESNPGSTALNKWIEGPLTKYVKRDMATPGDPVRALAEQGILHVNPETLPPGVSSGTPQDRARAGFPMWGTSESDLAKRWEDLSDSTISPRTVEQQLRAEAPWNAESYPWLEKLDPKEMVYHTSRSHMGENLGFSHLIDELKNSLNPESGLPRSLLLSPEQMQQLGMEKAVRHVDLINKWRAEQQAIANLAKSQSPAVQLFKEYAENNPKGLRWVEIKSRGPKATSLSQAEADQAAMRRELADQLKYEGDVMGHCVGGYCDDVIGGKSRIYSLRDAKGEPHVTIETAPSEEGSERIVQIKGKQNKAPIADYLPFVQDFVKSGKWSEVGDIHNTGLRRIADAFNENERKILQSAGHELQDYMTPEQIEALQSEDVFGKALEVWRSKNASEFARGGLIRGGKVV